MKSKYYPFFGNLANPLKISILEELKKNPSSVNELSESLNEEQSKISHALKALRNCSIVSVKKEGKKRIYELNKETILPMLKILDKHRTKYCKICEANKFRR